MLTSFSVHLSAQQDVTQPQMDNRQEKAISGHAHVFERDKSSPYMCLEVRPFVCKKAKRLVQLVSELFTPRQNLTKEGLRVLARITVNVRLCETEKTIRTTKEQRR